VKRRLIIFDTTLREGEQAPGCSMYLREKVTIARLLEKLNVDVIEAGFAAASQGEFDAIQAVCRALKKPIITSLCRALEKDVDSAQQALREAKRPRVHIILGTSDIHLKWKFKMSHKQVLARAVDVVKYANRKFRDVQFTAEDAGRTDVGFLCDVASAVIEAGASTVNFSDTVGYCIPEEFGSMIRRIKETIKSLSQARLSVHVHNDLGLALASTLAAIEAGADQAECTLNGLGDRAGICSLGALVTVLRIRQDYYKNVYTDIRKEFILPACRAVSKYIRPQQPYNN
jgi:2-isopropylmalate synthase